jgi:hypothetical protein
MDADMCLTVRERKKLKNRLKESTAYVFDVALLQAQVLGTAGPVRSTPACRNLKNNTQNNSYIKKNLRLISELCAQRQNREILDKTEPTMHASMSPDMLCCIHN